MKVTHQIKFDSPIMDFDINPSYTHLGVGMSNGTFILKKFKK
jgi:hypothetical protein